MKIRTRLFLAFFTLITLSIAVTGLLSYRVVRIQVLDETKAELYALGDELLPLLQYASPQEARQLSRLREAVYLRAGIDSLVVVTDGGGDVLVSNSRLFPYGEEVDTKLLTNKASDQQVNLEGGNYLSVSMPWVSDDGQVGGYLVLLADASDIRAVSRAFFSSQLGGFGLMLLLATVATAIMAASLTRPIGQLNRHAQTIHPDRVNSEISINTGDEIESLANSINNLGQRLNDYNQVQQKFLQNMSHEFKSPLMSIQGYAEGIRDGIFTDQDAHRGLDTIVDECQRLKTLVDQVVHLSRLEALTEMYEFEILDTRELVVGAMEKARGLASKAGVDLVFQDQGCSGVLGDAVRLEQALLNLLSNCIRHGKSEVVVKAWVETGKQVIEVIDDGKGFEDLDQVFRRFYKGPEGETGLGLAITKAIIDKHQGEIRAVNYAGGAKFVLRLPLK